MSITLSMVGCGEESTETANVEAYHVYDPGTKQNHRRIVNENPLGQYILKDGKTDYTVVIPNDKKGDADYISAKEELLLFFRRSTGVTLNTMYDGYLETTAGVENEGIQYSENSLYISLGDTSILRSSPVNGDKEKFDRDILVGDGYRIVTEGRTVFLLGDSSQGVLNAVYGFLELTLGFEWFGRAAYNLNTGVTNIPLYSYDVLEIPDILFRNSVNHCVAYYENMDPYKTAKATDTEIAAGLERSDFLRYFDRMKEERTMGSFCLRMFQYFGNGDEKYSATQHSSSECWDPKFNTGADAFSAQTTNLTKFDPEIFGEDFNAEKLDVLMPNWGSTTGGQWCYSAHGNELALQAMIYWTAMKIENSLMLRPRDSYPLLNTISLSIEDGIAQCDCSACIKEFNIDGGSYQGMITRVCNAAMDLVVEWMNRPENEPYRRNNLKCIYFAYSGCIPTPTEEDENGRLQQVNDRCKMNDNVGVWFCGGNGGQADYNTTYYSENPRSGSTVGNENFTKMLDYYAREAGCMWYYNYTGNYHDSSMYTTDWLSWYNHHNYQMLAYAKVQNQFHTHNFAMEIDINWGCIAQFLNSKLSWDSVSYTTDELLEKFMNCWFGPAAETMKTALNMVRIKTQTMTRHQGKEYADKNTASTWWTYNGFWKPYYDIIDQASKEAAAYPDKAMAQLYLERVEAELIAPSYQILQRFGKLESAPFSLEQKQIYVNRLGDIFSRYGRIAMSTIGGSSNYINWFKEYE